MNGQFFADIVKQVGKDLEESKYQHAEPRLSIYGRRYDEFEKLAKWAVSNDVYSSHIVWLIQIPRIFDIYKVNFDNPKVYDFPNIVISPKSPKIFNILEFE